MAIRALYGHWQGRPLSLLWHAGCLGPGVAILAPLIAFIGRQIGRLVQMVFGWASVMLFGRVPQDKQLLLAVVAIPYEEWEVLYRQRLQTERDLLRGRRAEVAEGDDCHESTGLIGRIARSVQELVR